MDMAAYRLRALEQQRIADLIELVPGDASSILDAGARDGYVSVRLAGSFRTVTALDLKKPELQCDNVVCVEGDITALGFPDASFDVVVCTEVLEHLPPSSLARACSELRRVARRHVVIGVPYEQDTRIARTTCFTCGATNPPWAHLNRFDRDCLVQLFPDMTLERVSFVGTQRDRTNALSTLLLDFAGNPYGTYDQEEPCVNCGQRLKPPPPRTFSQKVATKLAIKLNSAQSRLSSPKPNWIHVLFTRGSSQAASS